ncbi:chromate transporter [Paenibacillus silvae]|uniref:chromate transporter n=1 Tax=Paenibacillus silvae TaxID=1325358 RepID=UPI002004AC3B|nr:chromate transporter [Paenibacillus silvae]MCK6077050.1 chromate transporter [Paenibacillus silvae]MCK6151248.1 chromate transporter [Paenibacillus silvae]MCK6269736.1 chromate transporter [Paenibacillus silvae]
MSWKDYNGLVAGMMRTGILGYGGGPSVIPLIRYEAVTRYEWVSDDEFGEILAIANALPGPIATKMAAYLGYKTKGVMGAIVAVLAHILPTSIAIIALLGSMYALRESKIVAGMVAAVRPVIFVMLGMMAYEFAMKAWKGLGKWFAIAFGVIAFAALQLLNVHPGLVITTFLIYGFFHFDLVQRVKSKGNSDKEVS